MGVQPGMAMITLPVMVFFCRIFPLVMVGTHGLFFYAFVCMDNSHVRIGRCNFIQPERFKGHANGKIETGFG